MVVVPAVDHGHARRQAAGPLEPDCRSVGGSECGKTRARGLKRHRESGEWSNTGRPILFLMTVSPGGRIDYYYYASARISVAAKVASPVFRLALYYVEFYLNGLILQWNRMVDEDARHAELMKADIMSNVEAAKAFSQCVDRFWLDTHFYLICWDKINKHFRTASDAADSRCVREAWKEISDLTEKASGARHFLEHFSDEVKRGGYGQRGSSFTGRRDFTFWYVSTSNKGKKREASVNLGKAEVEKVMKAYESVLSCLTFTSR